MIEFNAKDSSKFTCSSDEIQLVHDANVRLGSEGVVFYCTPSEISNQTSLEVRRNNPISNFLLLEVA
jgi:hypothetical protein